MKYSLLYQDNQYMEKNTFFAFKYRSAVTPGISRRIIQSILHVQQNLELSRSKSLLRHWKVIYLKLMNLLPCSTPDLSIYF